MRLARYARVSTDEQSTVESQLALLMEHAARLGGSVVATETDVMSASGASSALRPGYRRLLELARSKHIDGVVVWKLDRFGRDHVESLRAVYELQQAGVRVYSMTEPTDDPFVRDLLLLLANREASVLSQRVQMAQRASAAEGNWMWPAPLGYRTVHRTPDDPRSKRSTLEPTADAPKLLRLFELAASGEWSLRALVRESVQLGLVSKHGRPLGPAMLRQVLANPAYVGDIVHGRRRHGKYSGNGPSGKRPESEWTVVRDAHPAIVSRETFDSVQRAFAQHKRFQGSVRHTKFLLTGLVYCGECGGRMYGANSGQGYVYGCYRGVHYGDCVQKGAGGQGVDEYVRRELSKLSITPRRRALAEEMVREQESARAQEAGAQRRNLLRERERHEQRRMDLVERLLGHAEPSIASDVYQRYEQRELEAIRIIDQALAGIEDVQPLDISGELSFLEQVRWEEFDAEAWREAVTLLVERVVVRKAARRNRWGEPGGGRVEVRWTSTAQVIMEVMQSVV